MRKILVNDVEMEEMEEIDERMEVHIPALSDCPNVKARFIKIYELYHQALKKFLLNRTGNDFEQVEEILQESFLSLFRHIKAGNKVTHDRGLLFKIAKNQLIDFHRRKFKESMYVSPLDTEKKDFPSLKPSYEQVLSDEQDLSKLENVIACLPTRCREVFMLSRFEEMKHRQIANTCGISVSMVEKHLKKAFTIIRSKMNA